MTITLQDVPDAYEEDLLPRVLPAGWHRLRAPGPAFECDGIGGLRGVKVLFSIGVEEDGRQWIHVSLSRRGRVPSWDDCVAVKRIFLGDARYAYQVIPPQADHYDLGMPGLHVLHLWALVAGESALPNFLRARGGTL